MELKVVSAYSDEEQHYLYVNKQIKDRITTVLAKQYNVKFGFDESIIIYKSPNYYSNNKLKNIIKLIIYNIDFLIQDILNSNKYFIMQFDIEDNKIIVNAYNPNQVKKFQGSLDAWFNSIEDAEIIIKKQYPEWKYQ